MKKTFFAGLIFLFSSVFNYSFSMNDEEPIEPSGITTLIINADVTIMLVNSNTASLKTDGEESFQQSLIIKRSGDTLTISSKKSRDLTEAGVIYVSAGQLKSIRINSKAVVRSFSVLQVPDLTVVVNGECNFAVANIGRLSVTGSDRYDVEHTTDVRHWPKSMIR